MQKKKASVSKMREYSINKVAYKKQSLCLAVCIGLGLWVKPSVCPREMQGDMNFVLQRRGVEVGGKVTNKMESDKCLLEE